MRRVLVIGAVAGLALSGCGCERPMDVSEPPSDSAGVPEPADTSSTGRARPAAPARDTSAPLQTDSLFYAMREQWVGVAADVSFSFRNPLPDTIYVVNCREQLNVSLETRSDREWKDFWSPILMMCLSKPIAILPGSTFHGTAKIYGAPPEANAAPRFPVKNVDGIYRLKWGSLVLHYDDRRQGFGDPVPVELRVSNPFALDDPRY